MTVNSLLKAALEPVAPVDTIEKRRAIKKALAAAGTTWPSYTNASDKEGQHHVFECQLARGVGAE